MKNQIIATNKSNLKDLILDEIKENGYECSLNHIDVSNIEYMNSLFSGSQFNGDISMWDTSNVVDMSAMFSHSHFNKYISNWNVSKVKNMWGMFHESKFNGDISKWNVQKVRDMESMFYQSEFKQDLTNWKPFSIENKSSMFYNCSVPAPYWFEAEDTLAAVKSHWLNKELEDSLIDKSVKNNKIKI